MSKISQTSRIVQLVLDMLETDEQELVLQKLNNELGIRNDIARIYSDKDLAERYGVDVRTARKWISNGKIKGFQNENGRWYTRSDWIDEYEKSCTGGGRLVASS